MGESVRVTLSVVTDKPEAIAKAADVLSRTAAGLVLDGHDVFLSMYPESEED